MTFHVSISDFCVSKNAPGAAIQCEMAFLRYYFFKSQPKKFLKITFCILCVPDNYPKKLQGSGYYTYRDIDP